jgi:hypothetical protein
MIHSILNCLMNLTSPMSQMNRCFRLSPNCPMMVCFQSYHLNRLDHCFQMNRSIRCYRCCQTNHWILKSHSSPNCLMSPSY